MYYKIFKILIKYFIFFILSWFIFIFCGNTSWWIYASALFASIIMICYNSWYLSINKTKVISTLVKNPDYKRLFNNEVDRNLKYNILDIIILNIINLIIIFTNGYTIGWCICIGSLISSIFFLSSARKFFSAILEKVKSELNY